MASRRSVRSWCACLLVVSVALLAACSSEPDHHASGGQSGEPARAGSAGSAAGTFPGGAAGSAGGAAIGGNAGSASSGGLGGAGNAGIAGNAGATGAGTAGIGGAAASAGAAGMGGAGMAGVGAGGSAGGAGSAGMGGAGASGAAGMGGAGVSGSSGMGGAGVSGSAGAAGSAGTAGSAGMGTGFTCDPTCGSETMCCPRDALMTSCVARTQDGCTAADLTVSEERAIDTAFVEWAYFAEDSCALVEECVGGTGWRRLLRFETFTPNVGTADLKLGAPDTSNPVFEYSSCHDHFHFKGYAQYDLLAEGGSIAAEGHKQAFCLLDSERTSDDDDVRDRPRYDCDDQGISKGWGDSYTADLDCQWVDVTDVPAGEYQLRIRINESRTLQELRYDNNEITIPIEIPEDE
jgi:hypothetical protein